MSEHDALGARLEQHRAELQRFVEKNASGLLRHESPEDLVQMVHELALRHAESARFEDRGDAAFDAWLHTLARGVIADRHDHWRALKRDRARILRLTVAPDAMDRGNAREPAVSGAGPATRADRREQLALVTRVLDALPERDRLLVQWSSQNVPLEEQAVRLGATYGATQRAGVRALERFKKAFRLAAGGGLRR